MNLIVKDVTSHLKRIRHKRSSSHPGFANVAQGIARSQGLPIERANAILASQTRRASVGAKRQNPRLARVLGKKKKKR